MKFKVGDKVRLRKKLKQGAKYKGILFEVELEKFKEKTGIINHIKKENGEKYYRIKEFYDCWYSEDMLELIEEHQFTKEDFKFGDIVTLRNETKTIVTRNIYGLDLRDKNDYAYVDYNYDLTSNIRAEYDIMKVQRIDTNKIGECLNLEDDKTKIRAIETIYERKEEILDKEEKEYLSKFVRPFRNKIRKISKNSYRNEEWLFFIINRKNGIEHFSLPSFDKNTMYKGMEINKEYTLEELGL